MKKLVLFFISVLSIPSCNFFRPWDFGSGYKLGENPEYKYDIILDRADTTFYHDWGNGRKTLQKGVLVKFHRPDNNIDSIFIWKGSSVVSSFIDQIKFDSIFIIVNQKPLDSIWGKYININYAPRRSKEPERFIDAKKKLMKSKIHYYWIIRKRTDDVYGPLNRDEYLQKRKELGVPNELRLKQE